MKILCALFLCLAVATTPIHADTIQNFYLEAQNNDGWATGMVTIDTTTGMALTGDITFHLYPDGPVVQGSFEVSGDFGPTRCGDCFDYPTNRFFDLAGPDHNGNTIYLELQTPITLVDYKGGLLCNGTTPCDGQGEGSIISFVLPTPAGDLRLYESIRGTLTPTPEPSTLVLLGTGALSLLGAARKKFGAARSYKENPRT